MEGVDWRAIAALWGAAAGTIGTVIALYAAHLARRRDAVRVEVLDVGLHVQAPSRDPEIILRFDVSLANRGLVPTSVTAFSLRLPTSSRKLLTRLGCQLSGVDDPLPTRHSFLRPDSEDERPEKRVVHNRPIQLTPGAYVDGITVHLQPLRTSAPLPVRLEQEQEQALVRLPFTLVARLSTGGTVRATRDRLISVSLNSRSLLRPQRLRF